MECGFSMNTRDLGYRYHRLEDESYDIEDQKESSNGKGIASLNPYGFKLLKEKLGQETPELYQRIWKIFHVTESLKKYKKTITLDKITAACIPIFTGALIAAFALICSPIDGDIKTYYLSTFIPSFYFVFGVGLSKSYVEKIQDVNPSTGWKNWAVRLTLGPFIPVYETWTRITRFFNASNNERDQYWKKHEVLVQDANENLIQKIDGLKESLDKMIAGSSDEKENTLLEKFKGILTQVKDHFPNISSPNLVFRNGID